MVSGKGRKCSKPYPYQVGAHYEGDDNVALGVAEGRGTRGGDGHDLEHFAPPGLVLLCLRRSNSPNNGEHVSGRLAMMFDRCVSLVDMFLWVSHDGWSRIPHKDSQNLDQSNDERKESWPHTTAVGGSRRVVEKLLAGLCVIAVCGNSVLVEGSLRPEESGVSGSLEWIASRLRGPTIHLRGGVDVMICGELVTGTAKGRLGLCWDSASDKLASAEYSSWRSMATNGPWCQRGVEP